MVEFILARYNYWIVIILMMMGLYIVFSRGNLVKTIIGLNIFQTSVFIFYITIGKVAGGTAPILIKTYGDKDKEHGGDHHGDHHSDDHGASHGEVVSEEGHNAHTEPLSAEDAAAFVSGDAANALPLNEPGASTPDGESQAADSLHTLPDATPSNALTAPDLVNGPIAPRVEEVTVPDIALSLGGEEQGSTGASHSNVAHGDAAHADGGYGAEAAADILYSNPLPHVLILTAIVVGVATTAVGLSIAVRIREAYGTVEEDALEQLDNAAEFGAAPGEVPSR